MKPKVTVSVDFTPEMFDALEAAAKKVGLVPSALLRKLAEIQIASPYFIVLPERAQS